MSKFVHYLLDKKLKKMHIGNDSFCALMLNCGPPGTTKILLYLLLYLFTESLRLMELTFSLKL